MNQPETTSARKHRIVMTDGNVISYVRTLSESFLFYAQQGIALRGHRESMETQMKDLVMHHGWVII